MHRPSTSFALMAAGLLVNAALVSVGSVPHPRSFNQRKHRNKARNHRSNNRRAQRGRCR